MGRGESQVDSIRWLPKGHTVGNERHVTLRRSTRVAVIPVGYQQGYGVDKPISGFWDAIQRLFRARRRTVRVNGQRTRVLGALGATETLLDVTGIKCSEGDTVTFDLNPLYARGFRREYR